MIASSISDSLCSKFHSQKCRTSLDKFILIISFTSQVDETFVRGPRRLKEWMLESAKDRKQVVGLNFVQEFLPAATESSGGGAEGGGPAMYKCMLFECDGAWGDLDTFSAHLSSHAHVVACLKENGSINKLITRYHAT